MRRQRLHHVLTIAFVLPIFGVAAWAAVDTPALLNPWNTDAFGGLWVLVLPAFLGSVGILANSVLGLVGAKKANAQHSSGA